MLNILSADPNKSKGRQNYEVNEESHRTIFERDRDRIIHSNSFRKLKHKTQVFIESDSDYYRTRLTHSLEVAQISRSLCRAMNLNEDLGEVVSLSHDLGHPPFGHTGEIALNESMISHGGFDHNDQALRVITLIEKRHPDFDGLNLCWESLEGIAKHNGKFISNPPPYISEYNNLYNLSLDKNPYLESQIASVSDDIAYNNHDIEDALRAKLISLDSLMEINYFKNIIIQLKDKYKNIEDELLIYQMLRISISKMINDIINNSKDKIAKFNITDVNDVFNYKDFVISMSESMNKDCYLIKDFLYLNVYNHKSIYNKKKSAAKIINKLFDYYINNFHTLPQDWLSLEKNESKYRIICDYISGMTDRYSTKLYQTIYD